MGQMRKPQEPKVIGKMVYIEKAPLLAYGHPGRSRGHSARLGDRASSYHHHHPLDPVVDRGRTHLPCSVASFLPAPSTASGLGSINNLIRNGETERTHRSFLLLPTSY